MCEREPIRGEPIIIYIVSQLKIATSQRENQVNRNQSSGRISFRHPTGQSPDLFFMEAPGSLESLWINFSFGRKQIINCDLTFQGGHKQSWTL